MADTIGERRARAIDVVVGKQRASRVLWLLGDVDEIRGDYPAYPGPAGNAWGPRETHPLSSLGSLSSPRPLRDISPSIVSLPAPIALTTTLYSPVPSETSGYCCHRPSGRWLSPNSSIQRPTRPGRVPGPPAQCRVCFPSRSIPQAPIGANSLACNANGDSPALPIVLFDWCDSCQG
jgi:hypothetical protein